MSHSAARLIANNYISAKFMIIMEQDCRYYLFGKINKIIHEINNNVFLSYRICQLVK